MMGPNLKVLYEGLDTLKEINETRIVSIDTQKVVYLSSIASSLATIADKLTEGDWKDVPNDSEQTDDGKH